MLSLYQAQQRHAAHYLSKLTEADEQYCQGRGALVRGLSLFEDEWTNIQSGQSWAASWAEEDDDAALMCVYYPLCGVHLLGLRQHPRENLRWMKTAADAAHRLGWLDEEGALSGNLGIAMVFENKARP
jgi:hypothetical protein